MPYSTAPSNGRAQKLVTDHDPDQSSFSPLIPRPSSRRTLSLSSSPSFSSSNSSLASFSLDESNANNSPFSPTTPLHSSGQVPFSWEQIPGIPKNKQLSKKKCNDPSLNISLLPLPPAGNPVQKSKDITPRSQKKQTATTSSFRKDPFFAALVECSKGNDGQGSIGNFWKSSKITRTLSDRLGLVSMYTNSCKTTCAVSKSMVYLPRSSHDIYHNNIRGSR